MAVESRAFEGSLEDSAFEPADDAPLFVLTPFDRGGQRSGTDGSGGCFWWGNKPIPATHLLSTVQRSPRRSDLSPLISRWCEIYKINSEPD